MILYDKKNKFSGDENLNPCAQLVKKFFAKYIDQQLPLIEDVDIETITIHDQKANRATHKNDLAVDISISPIYLIPYFWVYLHKYTNFNVALSMHNQHIHIDIDKSFWGSLNNKRLEIKTGENQYRFIKPQEYFIKNLPKDVIDNNKKVSFSVIEKYNLPIVDRYNIRAEYNSLLAPLSGKKGSVVYATFVGSNFTEVLSDDDKAFMTDFGIVSAINKITDIIINLPDKVPDVGKYGMIILGIVGAAGLIAVYNLTKKK